jgi:beta-phosphoglucomutase-like phosphatase (HAD superfamily)
LRFCVASNGSHEKVRRNLTRTGLARYFEGRMFSAQDVSRGKPSPDLFLHAAATLNVDPSACVVVEDSPTGLTAARAAGMRCLAYASGILPADRLRGPGTRVFTTMDELPDLLLEGEQLSA